MMSYLTKLRAQKKGFTLIVLIVVIAIIGVLMAILVPSMIGWVNSSRRRTAEANAKNVYKLVRQLLLKQLTIIHSLQHHLLQRVMDRLKQPQLILC